MSEEMDARHEIRSAYQGAAAASVEVVASQAPGLVMALIGWIKRKLGGDK